MKKINFLLIGSAIFLLCSTLSSAKKFTDIQEGDKYYITSRYLSANGIINGYSDGTFKPSQDINRAELLKIIFEGNKTKTTNPSTNCFPDVGYQEWYSKYVCTAKKLNIISGYKDGTFRPTQTVNKGEALKILGEFYKWNTQDKPNQPWYSKYIDFGKNGNLLEDPANFNADENMSRGEISSTLYRFLANQEYGEEKFSDDIENKVAIKINAQDLSEEAAKKDNSVSRNINNPETIQLARGKIKIIFSWKIPEATLISTQGKPLEQTEFSSYLLEPNDEELSYKHKIDSKLDAVMESGVDSETFTILNLKPDVKNAEALNGYLFYAQSLNGDTTFNAANAKIEVYDENGLAKSFTAYPNVDRIWKVFTLDENYDMRIFNTIGTCDDINRSTEVCPIVPGE